VASAEDTERDRDRKRDRESNSECPGATTSKDRLRERERGTDSFFPSFVHCVPARELGPPRGLQWQPTTQVASGILGSLSEKLNRLCASMRAD
jgi:hypothetical protein